MIPLGYITEWRQVAPWNMQAMVEQDLLINRMLTDLFSDEQICGALAFRGGTALHKLIFPQPLRYSEDIDLVQIVEGPIGPIFDRIREILSSWLGDRPQRKQGPGVVNLVYRVESEETPPRPLKIKIEINSREHFHVHPLQSRRLETSSRWFAGSVDIPTYEAEELLGTKLRALYQRRKGRDLLDIAAALRMVIGIDPNRIIECFDHYMAREDNKISRSEFERNLDAKLNHPGFREDCIPLVRPEFKVDLLADADLVKEKIIYRLS